MSTLGSGRLNSLISRIRNSSNSPRSPSSPTPTPGPTTTTTTTTTSALSQLKPSRRAINDFYIKLDYPHRRYKPGEHITGSIVLTTSRATRITHLTLTLGGSVMVYPHDRRGHKWGEDVVKDVTYRDNKMIRGCRSRGTTIEGRHNGRGVVLFEEEQVIVGEGRLGAGGLEVGFVIEFPSKGGINSLDFERGAITYLLTATLTRPTTIHTISTCTAEIKFSENIDVSMFSPPKPLTISIEPQRPLRRLKSSGSSNDSTTYIQTLHQPPNLSPPLSPSLPKTPSNNTPSLPPSPTVSAQPHPMATIELLRPACLPGESIPIRITVSHNRPLKSMSGVITTLSRQCRLDTLPPADKVLTASSLSFSKSCVSTFRKDLNQSITALIVDPRSLTTVIKTSVRIPGDAFPTISKVPQGVLEFTYFVEVVVDLGGKLASRNGVGDVIMDGSTGEDLKRIQAEGIMETDRIRREKGVISCTFEVVVGTIDTGKRRRRKDEKSKETAAASTSTPSHTSSGETNSDGSRTERDAERDQTVAQVMNFLDAPEYQNSSTRSSPSNLSTTPPPPIQPPPMIPPTLPSAGDEKALARLAEEQLLPSAPPLPGPSDEASAPPLLPYDEEDLYFLPESSAHGAAAPAYERPNSSTPRSILQSQEDKGELERQRLLNEASAPPVAAPATVEPSAPDIVAGDENRHNELPRYIQ
ncbi:ph-response sensor protein [Arthrobotrys conoides]|uniref:Ph-response sensor protein n=1 Tax=Arthrobotrys conoides TaxID=74498 RepID=A0AAN8RT70_9PEZI